MSKAGDIIWLQNHLWKGPHKSAKSATKNCELSNEKTIHSSLYRCEIRTILLLLPIATFAFNIAVKYILIVAVTSVFIDNQGFQSYLFPLKAEYPLIFAPLRRELHLFSISRKFCSHIWNFSLLKLQSYLTITFYFSPTCFKKRYKTGIRRKFGFT